MKVLVLGGTGFIGSNLVHKLHSFDCELYLLARQESNFNNLESIIDEIEIRFNDLSSGVEVDQIIEEIMPDYIFNLAQPGYQNLGDSLVFSTQINETTSLTYNLLNALVKYQTNLKSYVHACSSTVYHWSPELHVLSEETPLLPSTLRGLIKLNERNIYKFFASQYNVPIRIGRVFRAYGPYDHDYKLIVKALKSTPSNPIAIGKEEFKRDYIFVEDLIDGFLMLATSDVPSGIEVNFGSGDQYSAIEIIRMMENILSKEIPKTMDYQPNVFDRGNYLADIGLAKNLLDWTPRTNIREGLLKTIDWFQKL